jgi:HEAT repeats
MTRRRLKIIAVAIFALLLALAFRMWLSGPKEPTYDGKPLSTWLENIRGGPNGRGVLAERSVEAVRSIGTNAIPHLLAMLRCKDTRMDHWFWAVSQRVSFLHGYIPVNAATRRERAMYGFRTLGSDIGPAIPELTAVMLYSPDDCPYPAYICAWNSLTYAPPESVVPVIAAAVTNSNNEIRLRAVHLLGSFRGLPDIGVSALVEALKDPDVDVRATAAGSLGMYGGNAEAAVPSLISFMDDTNATMRSNSSNALAMIRSEVIQNGRSRGF